MRFRSADSDWLKTEGISHNLAVALSVALQQTEMGHPVAVGKGASPELVGGGQWRFSWLFLDLKGVHCYPSFAHHQGGVDVYVHYGITLITITSQPRQGEGDLGTVLRKTDIRALGTGEGWESAGDGSCLHNLGHTTHTLSRIIV